MNRMNSGSISFDDKTFQGVVAMEIDKRYQFPADTSAKIQTSGLLGDQYVGLEPGGDDKADQHEDATRERREPDRRTVAEPHRVREGEHLPAPLLGLARERAVGVHGEGVPDGLEHRDVGCRVGVGVAGCQVDAVPAG